MTTKVSWESDNKEGRYVRQDRTIRNKLGEDERFPAENGRYHLYVSHACPWAHRTMIAKTLFGLDISHDVVDYLLRKPAGWTLKAEDEDHLSTGDSQNGFKTLRQVYEQTEPDYDQTVTVPVLYDKKQKQVVNNESSEILRMLNTQFRKFFTKNKDLDLYPENLRAKIDELNGWIYNDINNGVYKSGFATTQEAHEEAVNKVFSGLDKVEEILSKNRYLCGENFTEADIRLWTTLVRFDPVYVCHFKCNKKMLRDYPNIWNFTKELYQIPAFKDTTHVEHIKLHYFKSHEHLNPKGIVPLGPSVNYDEKHDREKLKNATKFE